MIVLNALYWILTTETIVTWYVLLVFSFSLVWILIRRNHQ